MSLTFVATALATCTTVRLRFKLVEHRCRKSTSLHTCACQMLQQVLSY